MRDLTASDIRALLKKYSVKPSKKMGQSFLKSSVIARKIVDQAELTSEDTVLEIGGGLGILTNILTKHADHVYVIEIEPGLVRALHERFAMNDTITIIDGDALQVELPQANKIVSNLPYSISSEVTFRLLKEMAFDRAILMFQKEFAERLVATPCTKQYSRLTIDITYQANITPLFDVTADQFFPVPAVDSTVVQLTHRRDKTRAIDDQVFFWMITGLYSYPNKQLRKALKIWFRRIGEEKTKTDNLLERARDIVNGTERLRCLDMMTLVNLSNIVYEMIEEKLLNKPKG